MSFLNKGGGVFLEFIALLLDYGSGKLDYKIFLYIQIHYELKLNYMN